jgi:antirestriction protein ArdC
MSRATEYNYAIIKESYPELERETKNRAISDEVMHALVVSGRFENMKEAVASLGDPRLDSLAAEYDSRMLVDAAFIRIKDHLNKVGAADQKKIISKAITSLFGRKTTLEARVQEGRVSIKGAMNTDGMIGDEKISDIVDMVNETLESRGLETINKDTLFPKDESGGFVKNLSSSVPGAPRMSSGRRFVARTSSSRRADAGAEAASRRNANSGRFSSGAQGSSFRDENGRMNPSAMRDAAVSATIPKSTIDSNTSGQNLEDFEKAVKTRAQIAEMFNINGTAKSDFTVYDLEDEMIKAGFSEEEATNMVDSLVSLDSYIEDVGFRFSEARDVIDRSIEEIEDSLEKIERLKKERADILKEYGEEDGQPWLEAIDEKIVKATEKVENSYQEGAGSDSARMGTLHSQAEEILEKNPGWGTTYPKLRDISSRLVALEASMAKAGGTKKSIPITKIDFGLPEGTRLSSGKVDEYFQNLTSHLIEMIEKSQTEGGKWEAPWHRVENIPKNASTNNMYSGGNLFALMLAAQEKGYETPVWGGFQQWKSLGGSVRKGEKGTQILIPRALTGEEIDPETGEKRKVSKGFAFTTGYVFNLDQIDGINKEDFIVSPTDGMTPEQKVGKLEEAIGLVGAEIRTGDGSRAYYSPMEDHVVMPPFELFKSPEGYYGTLGHELVHWTGHSSRLDRKNMNQFGSPDYAKEELVAEFGSAFLLAKFGLSVTPREDHAHYLANWLKVLRDEPNALQEASAKAQEAAKLLIDKMQSVLSEMGETSSDVDTKSLHIFKDPFYGVKDAYTAWVREMSSAPYFIKSLTENEIYSGNMNRRWERVAEAAIFLSETTKKN